MRDDMLEKSVMFRNLYIMNYSERLKTMALLGRDYKDDEDFKSFLKTSCKMKLN